ncbi:PAS domain S-box protein [Pedobacter sp. MC2016-14]|uniref:PAS domain-containing sensor histidine kinase n=1 Tax=Pedobacter sp. MC2016-14 TaxID=2897327 RepID=UPI001E3296DD|nr:PAS domain-containing sensor histidine kinase [Pedobacter sp. MC2016-14]MCD0488813.1 PAS domain S-box protein [Pedobacter sp. MC2016-14]
MHKNLSFLQGGGQLGELIRNKDWSATDLDAPVNWPESLRSAITISLNSGFPIAIYWGQNFVLLYNDAWSSIPGDKHPWALGNPGPTVWPEIWDGLKDEFESVLNEGKSYRRPDAPLYMYRYGYTEECYFDYTLSPIVAVDGSVDGVFNAVVETTYRVINERRNGIRSAFLSQAHTSATRAAAYNKINDLLQNAVLDISFFAFYKVGAGTNEDELVLSKGLNELQLQHLHALIGAEQAELKDLDQLLPEPVFAYWPEPVTEAMVVPIYNGEGRINVMLVLGASARKRIDEDYRQFLQAVAANSGAMLNNAFAAELNLAYQKELMLNAELFEEQQALNEEISAANEELSASNEELATTNEELSETQAQLNETLSWLGESEQRFRNLIREATVGVILLMGPNLIVDVVNDAYAKLIGRSIEDLINKPLFDIIPEAEEAFKKVIEPVMNTGEAAYLYEQAYFVHNDEAKIEGLLNLTYQPYRESDGKITGVMVLCQDVTAQVKARQQVEATERRFQFMLNAIPQQVWTATPEGSLNYVNQVVADDFGVNSDVIVNTGWSSFIHPDDLPSSTLSWNRSLKSGEEYLTEFRLKFADGTYIWHLARAVPLIENGEITLWLGTNTNIEAQKENEQRKDEFLSIASHELKTPLTGIKAFNQLMRKSKDQERTASYIEKSSENIYRLEKLINDLLDVTKINAGKLTYDFQSFNFSEMLRESVESVQLTTSTHQLVLDQVDELFITGDRLRLEQVINNFLSNAIKYSPGGKQVIIKSQVDGQGLIVSVKDFGIGIQAQHIQRLFDRYYRIDNTAMRFEGLGLGLFISSEILKRHMGTFWIESQPNEGSTFYFRLPLAEAKLKEPIIEDDDKFYKDEHITIIQNKEAAWLEVDWKGFQTVEAVKAGGMRMLAMLKAGGFSKVLNDNTHVVGTWSEASDWAGQEWFPMMEEAGLKYFAWIYSPSAFSRLSAEKAVDVKVGNSIIQFFTDLESAKKWLADRRDI